uniref:Uncharacterized protein n=1 Tax=Ditylenchus dipsaci TaxID=166011 RepID=A0A915DRG2_9BILA
MPSVPSLYSTPPPIAVAGGILIIQILPEMCIRREVHTLLPWRSSLHSNDAIWKYSRQLDSTASYPKAFQASVAYSGVPENKLLNSTSLCMPIGYVLMQLFEYLPVFVLSNDEKWHFLGMMGRSYQTQLRCYSMPYFGLADADKINSMNHGGNILLPNSALDNLTRLNVQYPLLFKIQNPSPDHQRATHAGVLEFLAEEGNSTIFQIMRQLQLTEGAIAIIEYKSLPMASFAKFKPMSTDFLSISNPRAILEVELRKYRCLTKNDMIAIEYNDQVLEFKVMDLKPETQCLSLSAMLIWNLMHLKDMLSRLLCSVVGILLKCLRRRLIQSQSSQRVVSLFGDQPGPSSHGAQQKINSGSRVSSCSSMQVQSSSGALVGVAAEVVADEDYQPGFLKFVRYNYKNRSALDREKKVAEEKLREQGQSSMSGSKFFSGAGQTIRR